MSGHSKWSTIKHKKGAQDAKRGKIFTKLIREIAVAARGGGGLVDTNPALRSAILKARTANMPNDNIERAIKKGTGELEGVNYEELSFEGYGPGGVAMLVQCLTDNKNRTTADVRSIFNKSGGNLGEHGCVAYLFARKGIIRIPKDNVTEDVLFEVALESGAENVENSDQEHIVITDNQSFTQVHDALQGYGPSHAEQTLFPDSFITLNEEKTQKAVKLIESLEDNDDVQEVASNLNLDSFRA